MDTQTKAKITFISAGAGSGKTHRLTDILHNELTLGGVRPSGVIATTFTNKAATELRERVREHLMAQGNFLLANTVAQARIGTVNSVCGQIISRFSFEAGVSTEQRVIEEAAAKPLLERAMDAVLSESQIKDVWSLVRRLGLEDSWTEALQALVNQLRSNDVNLNRVQEFAQRNANDLLSYFPAPTSQNLDADLLREIRLALPAIEATVLSGGKKNSREYRDLIVSFARSLERKAARWSEWAKVAKALPEKSLHPVAEQIGDLAGRFAEHPGLHNDVREYLRVMFTLAADALTAYQSIKRELGVLDFADQEHQLLGLLDHPDVAAVLSEELDLLMVDEFQDTSPIQLALFMKLANFAKKVFWVGDIKQAIYGFRGSDTELMQSILRALPELGASKEVLPSSWRSRPELVSICNAVFTDAFAGSLPKQDVELVPKRAESLTEPSFANWMLQGKNVGEEASALAAGIRKLMGSGYQVFDKSTKTIRPARLSDVAILSKTHDGVQVIVSALANHRIPVATSQPGLLSTPEAVLAVACLRRLNDPGDTVATAEIVSLTDCVEAETWLADRLSYLAKGHASDEWLEVDADGHPANPALQAISNLRASMPVLSPQEALISVISECGLPDKVVRWNVDPDRARMRLANIEALIALAAEYEDSCQSSQQAASVSGLILWLAEVADQKTDMLAEPGVDAVKVMTHHAAKGLEWPVVVLTDLSKDIKDRLWSISAQNGNAFEVKNPLGDRFIRYWPWPFGAQKKVSVADSISLSPVAQEFRTNAIEEAKRLLYVSMTRARDLMIIARSERTPSGEWLESVAAPWLMTTADGQDIQLPSGQRIAAMHWELGPLDGGVYDSLAAEGSIYWFPNYGLRLERLPLGFNPSTAPKIAAQTIEKCQVGKRIPVAAGVDPTVFGTALHACIGASFNQGPALAESDVERILDGFRVHDAVKSSFVLEQINSLHHWIRARWPNATAYAEYPIQCKLASGQVLNGRIDLLLEVPDGWILIDHKSSQLAADHWDGLAEEYGAQMAAYASALQAISGKPVTQSWLFLPVAGGALRIG